MEVGFRKLLLAAQLVWCASEACLADRINVFAAASLADALREIGRNYKQKTNHKVVFNFAASSFLARQIEEGAPADLFFSADEAKMDGLEKKGLIVSGTRTNLLSNTLVIVVAARSSLEVHSPQQLADASVRKVALADPAAVPAGIYAKKYLEQASVWPKITPKIIPMDNVRAALAAVESGNAEAAIVYKTDAAISRKVKVVYEVPREEGPEIAYSAAVVKESAHAAIAMNLLEYFCSNEAGQVFAKYGFIVRK